MRAVFLTINLFMYFVVYLMQWGSWIQPKDTMHLKRSGRKLKLQILDYNGREGNI